MEELITLKKDPLRLENTEMDLGMELSPLLPTDYGRTEKVVQTYGCDCSAGYALMKTEQ